MQSSNLEEFKRLNSVIVTEINKLQLNLSKYKEQMERIIAALVTAEGDAEEVLVDDAGGSVSDNQLTAMIPFGQYISQTTSTIDLTNKLNTQLQLYSVRGLTWRLGANKKFFVNLRADWERNSQTDFEQSNYNSDSDYLRCDYSEKSVVLPALIKEKIILSPRTLKSDRDNADQYIVQQSVSPYVESFQFRADIIRVEDSKLLIFYVHNRDDNETMPELQELQNLSLLNSVPEHNNVFGISTNGGPIARAVALPNSKWVRLIDSAQLLTLAERYTLYRLPLRLQLIPAKAIKCMLVSAGSLNDIERPSNCTQSFLANVLERNTYKQVDLKVIGTIGNVIHVHLFENQSSGRILERTKLEMEQKRNTNPFLNPSTVDFDKPTLSVAAFEAPEEKTGRFLNIDVTYVNGVTTFYAQPQTEFSDERRSPICWAHSELKESSCLQHVPRLGDLVLAEYKDDNFYYRAKVLNVLDPTVPMFKVFFVDYGNTEEVPPRCMAKCDLQHEDVPFRAVRCRLAGIEDITAGDDDKLQEAVQFVNMHLMDQCFTVEVLNEDMHDGVPELLVRIKDDLVGELPKMLVQLGYAKEK